jgi:predicted permease
MFSLVNALLLRPLYERPDEVVAVSARSTAPSGGSRRFSYPNYLDLREGGAGVFVNLAAYSMAFVGLDAGEGARRTFASAVTADYFQVFGQPLALGRPFTAEEERPGAEIRVAIISHPLWERHGADARMLGRSIRVNGDLFAVVGVAPKGFTGMSIPGPEVWLPLGAYDTLRAEGASAGTKFGAREAHELSVVGRLRAGTSLGAVAPALATIGRRLEQAFPAFHAGYTLEMSRPSRLLFMPGPGSGAVAAGLALALMAMPAIVLLVACLNLVDLLLARGQARRQEMAIRSSLGGGRGRLARQLITEGLLLALAGGAVGLLLSTWATDALRTSVRPVLPVALTLPELDLDWRVFAGTVGFTLAATLVFGAWPAWALTGRTAATDLKRRAGEERPRRSGGVRGGHALVIGQVALSLLLLATGGLFLMSALRAATADPGFRLDGGLLVEVDPGLAGYDELRGRQSHLALVDRLRTVPGVEAVTIGSRLPFTSGDSRRVAPAGAADAHARSVDAMFSVVGRDYARVLGLPMFGGRDFTDAELTPGSSERVAIVDDALAERLWPGEGAVGRLIQFLDAKRGEVGQSIRIVGIVPAVKHSLDDPRPSPHVYVPLGQHYESAMMLQLRIAAEARTSDAERAMLATVARVVRGVDERLPVLRVETWREHLDGGLDVWLYRTGARVFSAFAGIALLLAVIGVYGVKSYVVARRTREFGIRIAIGAHPRAVLVQVLREGGRITALGIGIGLLLALGAGKLLQSFLYGVDAVEPVVLVTAPLILLASSLLASYLPALRATKVDPTVALRSE